MNNVLIWFWQARPVLVRAIETGDLSEIVDPGLEKHYVESEMFRMIEAAAACVRHSAPKRPRMVQVILPVSIWSVFISAGPIFSIGMESFRVEEWNFLLIVS